MLEGSTQNIMIKTAIPNNKNTSTSEVNAEVCMPDKQIGLAAWMDRVIAELDRAQSDLNPEVVHDLRVALRRCLSLAELHMAFDQGEDWRKMSKQGRRLFKQLSELRDTQVMLEWLVRLGVSKDSAGIQLADHLGRREAKLHKAALKALNGFNLEKWRKRQARLSKVSLSVRLEDPVYQQLALKRLQTAYELHHQALRNRSQAAFHRLRIRLKHFRYTIENYLPQHHELWGNDLKLLQDALGEHHDLFVLWQTALALGLLADGHLRARWHARIEKESKLRLQIYRAKTVGRKSIWPLWRDSLNES
jgi:CHAD domain-containing protein